MTAVHSIVNPFALLLDPASVLQQVERSERLARLHSRVCRPLDKAILPVLVGPEREAFDLAVESADDEGEPN